MDDTRLVIVTGMSGAGRSRALAALEDFGYFCVDNLPPQMIPQVSALTQIDDPHFARIAVACDVRGGELFASLLDILNDEDQLADFRLLFLDCDDATLIRRFKESRRRHPLEGGRVTLARAIEIERTTLEPIRSTAAMVIDTSDLRASELRARIMRDFVTSTDEHTLSVVVQSFGFKYGTPTDADITFDVRFLPNPYWDPDLRPLSGKDAAISQFVLTRPETQSFLEKWMALLTDVLPHYLAEGKLSITVGIGCTGGRHRSVALSEETAKRLKAAGYRVSVVHRDIDRDPAAAAR
ncbi:MAG: RNase adapter RapZ [Actinomycetes bacterium]|jgi:UPF0042 nucleotide-binding protein|nr:RNase adapter RapZ [Actinomycetes bacterium]